ncbi:hypothetical protein [Methylomonas sp. CM2]|uniref:hypothetical protein n=1 Tax=Methylomonas sp. CM2 TaxID=3417647 RepID=UPI003CF248E8
MFNIEKQIIKIVPGTIFALVSANKATIKLTDDGFKSVQRIARNHCHQRKVSQQHHQSAKNQINPAKLPTTKNQRV